MATKRKRDADQDSAVAAPRQEDKVDKNKPLRRTKLFVRNLTEDATNEDLEAMFGEIGPLKRCFVVTEKGKKRCLGFGIVHYALEADALAAIKQFHGKEHKGKRLWVEDAKAKETRPNAKAARDAKKKKLEEEKNLAREEAKDKDGLEPADDEDDGVDISVVDKEPPPPAPPAKEKFEAQKKEKKPKPDGSELHVHGFPPQVHLRTIRKRLGKYGRVAELESIGEGSVRVRFKTPDMALKAVKKLNGSIFGKGEGEGREHKLHASMYLPAEKKARLIVRNLSWKVTEQDLAKAFEQFGKVLESKIPKGPDGLARGFAFVEYATLQEATQAIKNMNAKPLSGRPVAVDWSLPKDSYLRRLTAEKDSASTADSKNQAMDNDDKDEEEEESEQEDKPKKKKTKKEKAKKEEKEKKQKKKEKKKKEIKEKAGETKKNSQDKAEKKTESTKEEKEKQPEIKDEPKDIPKLDPKTKPEQALKKKEPKVEKKTEEAKDSPKKDLKSNEEKHPSTGETAGIESAEAVKKERNIETPTKPVQKRDDIQEGTSLFIRNLSFATTKESLKEKFEEFGKIRHCALVVDEATKTTKGSAFVNFFDKSGADAVMEFIEHNLSTVRRDARAVVSGGPQSGIFLDGRQLIINRAVDRNTARTFSLAAKQKKEEQVDADKRNLYLLYEGVITADSPAAAGLSEEDLQRREKAFEEKKRKLKKPHMFISPTRLSIRNLPKSVSDKELKELFREGVLKQDPDAKPAIRQAKVVLDDQNRSKGFGFVEFKKHEHALSALREINNNPEYYGQARRPIVEFALEDKRVVERHKAQQVAQKQKAKKDKMDRKEEGEEKEAPTLATKREKGSVATKKRTLSAAKQTDEKASKPVQVRTKLPPKEGKGEAHEPGRRQQKRRRKQEQEAEFEGMVSRYKAQFGEANTAATAKRWFEE